MSFCNYNWCCSCSSAIVGIAAAVVPKIVGILQVVVVLVAVVVVVVAGISIAFSVNVASRFCLCWLL